LKLVGFTRSAKEDLDQILLRYGEHDVAVAARFLARVKTKVEQATHFPQSGYLKPGWAEDDLRLYPLLRFPYTIAIAIHEGKRQVVAVYPQKDRPDIWLERLK
jgi:plasmid stabilization system protein ParE